MALRLIRLSPSLSLQPMEKRTTTLWRVIFDYPIFHIRLPRGEGKLLLEDVE
jgi:hypothetical protein